MGRIAAIAALVIAALVGGAVAFGAIPAGDGNIYACYSNGDGTVRVQSDPAKPCAKGWSPVKWSAGGAQTTQYLKTEDFPLPANDVGGAQIKCDDGDVVVSGGFSVRDNDGVRVRNNHPAYPEYWNVAVVNVGNTSSEGTAYAICQHTE